MSQKSTGIADQRKAANGKPEKPYEGFPLFAHATGRWAKKIKGRTYYFGSWDDPNGALELYLDQKDDLYAGRQPRTDSNATSMRQLCNQFLASKRADMDTGRKSPRTFSDYHRICGMLIDEFGASRAATDIRPTDFEAFHNKLSAKYSLATLGRWITMTRSVFKYAVDTDLIPKAVKFGPKFKVPSKSERRIEKARKRQTNGKLMFEPSEILAMLDKAGVSLKAMILLGINGGLGNSDLANLPITALDLDSGWLDYARGKTGIERRIPLWPETVEALRVVVARRKTTTEESNADVLFLTKYGQRWVRYEVVDERRFGKVALKTKQDDAIAKESAKLLKTLKLKRAGVGFYALRHSFETAAGGSKDQVAVDSIMGHADASMAAEYREHIGDDRLKAVVDHVHDWLYGKPEADGDGDDVEANEAEAKDDRPQLRIVG